MSSSSNNFNYVLLLLYYRNNQYLIAIQQAIPDKSIADCVEALIGCYLTTRGERSALRLMQWFGIDCLQKSGNIICVFLKIKVVLFIVGIVIDFINYDVYLVNYQSTSS